MNESTLRSIIEAIDEHGYCIIPRVLDAAVADAARGLIDELRRRQVGPQGPAQGAHAADEGQTDLGHERVLHLAARHPLFVEVMCHPVAMSIWSKLLGEDFICSTWSSNTLLPHTRHTYWHVDHPYWTIRPPYQVAPMLTGHTIWCLDEFTAENGATAIAAGSHRRPHMPEHRADCSHEAILLEAPKGSLIVAHGACWHTAGDNRSERSRTGIFGRYARSFLIPQEDLRPQLETIQNPGPLVARLMGAERYTPQRTFPY